MAEHIVPRSTYYLVFGALIVLTVITVAAANFNFGPLNDVVAMGVAVTKAMLVILFFMHVRYSPRLIGVVVAGMFLWLAIMLVLTFSDYVSRDWIKGLVTPGDVPRH